MAQPLHQCSGVDRPGTPEHPAPRPPAPAQQDDRAPLTGESLGAATSSRDDQGAEQLITFTLSSWAVARYTLVVALVLGGLSLLWRIHEVLLLLLLAILLATAIEPLVNYLRRGPFSRGQGVLIVYTGLFVTVAGLGMLIVPSLIDQIGRFIESLPERLAALRPVVEQIGPSALRGILLRGLGEAQPAVERTLTAPEVPTQPEQVVSAGGTLLHTFFSLIMVFLLAYYWLTERAAIKRAVLRLAPTSRARQINSAWLEVESKLGGWVRGQLLVMGALGLMAGLAFVALGLPNPLLLAVLAGLFEIIPILGPFLAFLPAFLVALAVDPTRAFLLVPIAIVIQQVEGNVLIPRVMSHTVGISPLTVILGILVGSILYGAAGAFIAVPVAAAMQVILNECLRPTIEAETQDALPPEAAPQAVNAGGPPPTTRTARGF